MLASPIAHTNMNDLLDALHLSDLKAKFAAERIDLDAARLLTEADLTTLGLPMGTRRKLLHALAPNASVTPKVSSSSALPSVILRLSNFLRSLTQYRLLLQMPSCKSLGYGG